MTKIISNLFTSRFNKFYVVKLASSFLMQFASLFLIYVLPASEYGNLALIISVASLMFVLTSGWNNGIVINLGSKNYADKGAYADIVLYRLIMIGISWIVITIVFLMMRSNVIHFIQIEGNYWLVYFLFLGLMAYDFSYQLLYPGNKNVLQASLELSTAIIVCLTTILLVKNVKDYIYLYSSISLIFAFSSIVFFVKYFVLDQKIHFVKKDFEYCVKYSLWQVPSVIGIYLINLGMNYIFVFNKIPIQAIGQYNFAFKLFTGFSAFFALFGIVIPKWVHSHDVNSLSVLNKKIVNITVFLSLVYIVIAFLLKPIIVVMGKQDYVQSATYYIFLFPAFALMCYCNLMNTVIANTPFYKYAQFAILVQVIVLVFVSYPLVYIIGLTGAIIATTISYLVSSFLFFYLFKKKITPYMVERLKNF